MIISTGCPHDCGGKCVLRCHVENGVIQRIDTDTGQEPQIRACARGRAYRQRVYHPERLLYPLKRDGERGEGKFKRISWKEALETVAEELTRVRSKYGNAAIWGASGPGSLTILHSTPVVTRYFFNFFGGCTMKKGGMSGQAAEDASYYTLGVIEAASSQEDILNSRLILLWSWNSAEAVLGCNTTWYLAQAKEKKIPIIILDPRLTDTSVLADEWIPIYPGTDAAMMLAMAYVMIKENLHDKAFIDKFTLGFEKFQSHLIGERDGVPKTPQWASEICGVPPEIIEKLARRYAATKPAALLPGRGMQRCAYGEQSYRASITLATMTGNIGISGGSAACRWNPEGGSIGRLPTGKNPLESVFPSSKWAEVLLLGENGGYPDIKLVYIVGSNFLNQFPAINKGIKALQKPEFIVCHEQFLTPTARFADIVLPVTTHLERYDISKQSHGNYAIFMNKVLEPMGEAKSDLEIFTALSRLLGISGFNDKPDEDWLREFVAQSEIPDYEEFKAAGIYRFRTKEPVAFRRQIAENQAFLTPSGKIEIYSQRLEKLGLPGVPSVPQYVEPWEGRKDHLASKYPLQFISTHGKRTALSVYTNLPWLMELEPHTLWVNPEDAKKKGIENGDKIKVFNDRGSTMLTARVTARIMPGVVSLDHGFWYKPGSDGTDLNGSPNILTRDEVTQLGWGGTVNSCLVQVIKLGSEGNMRHSESPTMTGLWPLHTTHGYSLFSTPYSLLTQMGFYFDQTRCTGCQTCVVACKDWNNIPAGSASWLKIPSLEQGGSSEVKLSYYPLTCFHCSRPTCISACPASAITKREKDGIVEVNRDLCEPGCHACFNACPYQAPQFSANRMSMCNFCAERLDRGEKPVCVLSCPMRALDSGQLEILKSKYETQNSAPGFLDTETTYPSIIFRASR